MARPCPAICPGLPQGGGAGSGWRATPVVRGRATSRVAWRGEPYQYLLRVLGEPRRDPRDGDPPTPDLQGLRMV